MDVVNSRCVGTGVYWKPVYNILEGQMRVMRVDPHHIKHMPGRKTDVKDAQWIVELLQYGLLKARFSPPPNATPISAPLRNPRLAIIWSNR